MLRHEKKPKKARHGFTLMEMTIVLGVAGLIIGAIWIAGTAVYSNVKIERAMEGVVIIDQNIKAIYPTKPIPGGALTASFITSKAFPQDWVSGVSVRTPFGGTMDVGSRTGWGGADASSTRKFEMVFWGMTSKDCAKFLGSLVGGADIDNFIWLYSDAAGGANTSGLKPVSPVIANCGGNVVLQFQL